MGTLRNTTTGASSWSANRGNVSELQCGHGRACNLHTLAAVDRVSFVVWSGFGPCAGLVRRFWTCHVMCETGHFVYRDRVRRKTDATLFVSNDYLSCRSGCIIEPTGFIFIMNKHTYNIHCYFC